MSLRRTCRISCDHPGCTSFVAGVNAAAARYLAREEHGWLIKKTDLCGLHRPDTRAARASRKDT